MKLKKPPMVRESDSKSNQPRLLTEKKICDCEMPHSWENFIFDYAPSVRSMDFTHSAQIIILSPFELGLFVHASLLLTSGPCKKIQDSQNVRFSSKAIFPEISGTGSLIRSHKNNKVTSCVVTQATKIFPLPSAGSTFCVSQPSRLARLDSLDVYVLPADKFPGNVRRSITPQEFLPVSTLFALRGWRAKRKIHYYLFPISHWGLQIS
jgi:hypothetical protein